MFLFAVNFSIWLVWLKTFVKTSKVSPSHLKLNSLTSHDLSMFPLPLYPPTYFFSLTIISSHTGFFLPHQLIAHSCLNCRALILPLYLHYSLPNPTSLLPYFYPSSPQNVLGCSLQTGLSRSSFLILAPPILNHLTLIYSLAYLMLVCLYTP